MTERLAALNASRDKIMEFFAMDKPVCPHCGTELDITENERWSLYEEGEHETECPDCEMEYTVSVRVSYSFSTNNQDE